MAFTIEKQSAKEPGAEIDREPRLQISLLGEFSIRQEDQTVSLPTPSYQTLLAYLIIHADQAHSRQKLAFQFWPDSTESQARTNLRKALYTLRHTLPDVADFLVVNQQTVQWRPDAPCDVDAWQFETAVTRSQQADSTAEQQSYLEQAAGAYHGDFLPGHYDDWILATREKLRHHYLAALEQLLLLHENQRQYPAAISLARRLLREDPLHEAAYRRLMRLQSLDGNVAGALRTYHTCYTKLQSELGVDPSPATRETYERLLRVKAPPTPLAPARLPLVARKQAWQSLQAAWKQYTHGQPGVVLLSGEAGIGKTRLAEELLDWAERQGIVVLTAVCYPSEKQLAYAPLAKWLRSDSLQPVFRRFHQRQLAECSRLLPELHDQHPDLPYPGPLAESWQRQHFFSVLAQTLLQLRQPFLLFVDDLHWCDQDTLDWLHYLLHYEPQSRFLLLGAIRSEEITADHRLIPWQQQLDRDGRLTKIRLKRLDAGASARLAGHVLQKDLDGRQVARLYAETEGNPLFVVEMARAGLEALHSTSEFTTLSPKVQTVIETRLASLAQSTQELAQLAAVIGRSFTFPLLNSACVQSKDAVIRGLDELWQRRIVRERETEAYDFSHDKIRQGAYASLSKARRRQFHLQVWQAMETLNVDNLDPVSGQIATHCEAAGYFPEAIAYYRRAAKAAQAVFANLDTLDYLQRAIDLSPRVEVDSQQQIEIYEQLGDVLALLGQSSDAQRAYKKVVSRLSETVEISRLQRKIAGLQSRQKQYDQAFLTLDETETLFGDLAHTSKPSLWQEWLGLQLDRLWLHYWVNDDEAMAGLVQKLNPIIRVQGTKMQLATFFQALVLLSFRIERYVIGDEVVQYAQESMQASEDSRELREIAFAHFFLGFTLLWHGYQGDLDAAEYHLQAGLEQAEMMGHVVLQCRCLSYLPVVYRKMGCPDKARDLAPSALTIAEQCQMPDYIANARGSLAWIAWRDGDLDEVQKQGEAALAAAQQLLLPIPMKWLALWPLLGVAVANGETAPAIEYAQAILEPNQVRMPEEITAVLQQAINSWENNQPDAAQTTLKQALQLAQTYHYL